MEEYMSSENEKAIDEEMIENAEAANDDDISDDDLVEQLDAEPESAEDEDADEIVEDDLDEDDTDDEAEDNGRFYDIDDPLEVDGDFEIHMEDVIEAVLFASDEPLSATRLVNVLEVGSSKQVRECIESLNKAYEVTGRPFRIEQIAGGYQMMTLSCFNGWLKKLLRVRTETKLSPAALETLAIVAYKQPVMRADIEAIRGVASGEMIRGLMYKGLVKIVGRAEVIGRPMLYGTTKKFLDIFGLNTIKDLPKIEELKKPAE